MPATGVCMTTIMKHIYVGIDLGTSGCRACAIDASANILALCTQPMAAPITNHHDVEQHAELWWQAVSAVLDQLFITINPQQVKAISIDGTSGTVLATDAEGTPLAPALMYNDSRCSEEARTLEQYADENSAAHGASSGLAKCLYLQRQYPHATHLLHQADWIAGQFSGRFDITDENNALKTGYDPQRGEWPDWLDQLKLKRSLLPKVVAPGSITATVEATACRRFNLADDCKLVAGTTDSIAAFIATGVSRPGEAVTSLGSTLVLKIISEQPVFSAKYGIYSHKLGHHWLAGGASNSGGAVLKQFFNQAQLDQMTPLLEPEKATGLYYYPLSQPGERFPHNNPEQQPQLSPRPTDDVQFFQGILEGISRIEHEGYQKLRELGANAPVSITTCGGGSHNPAWTAIRSHMTGVPVYTAQHTEACYGSALLARQGFENTLK